LLNNRIPKAEIYNELKEFVDPADLIINDYNIEQNGPEAFNPIPVKNNSELLGKLHHALKIDQYQKSEFRENLLIYAEKSDLITFFQEVSLIPKEKTNLSSTEILDFSKQASRLPWGENDYTKSFVNSFGYDESLIPIKEDVKGNVETVTTPKRDPATGIITLILNDEKPLKELYFYQSDLFFEANELVENRYTRFILSMPTGSGKTRTAMEIVTHFFNRDDKKQVVWLAGQNELNEQAIESFKHVWPHLGKKDKKIYRIWDKYESHVIEKNSFVFAGIQKLTNLLKKYPNLIQPDLIIVDEAHHAIARNWKILIEKLCLDTGARVIGLTATPIRGDDAKENDKLRKFFQDKILDIDTEDEEWPIAYLQKKGYLAKVVEKPKIKSEAKFTIPLDVLKAISRHHDLPDDFLEILAKNNKRNYAIAKKIDRIG